MPPRLSISLLRKGLAVVTATGLIGAAAIFGATTADAATTQTGSASTAAGSAGRPRPSGGTPTPPAGYARWSSTTPAGRPTVGTVPTDSVVRSYYGDGTRSRSRPGRASMTTGAARRTGSRNPLNPASAPGAAKVTITLGVDGDGHGNCSVTFVQPGGAGGAVGRRGHRGSASDRYEADVVIDHQAERTSRGLRAPQHAGLCRPLRGAARVADGRRTADVPPEPGPDPERVRPRTGGENVAYGYSSGQAVVNGWMNSSGHRGNILNSGYRLLGVGAVQSSDGRWYAAQVFGA